MYDECTEIAFGPVFGEDEDPLEFLDWTKADVITIPSKILIEFVDRWRKEVKETENQGSQYITTPVDCMCGPDDDVCSSCQEDLDYAEMCADEKWRSKLKK